MLLHKVVLFSSHRLHEEMAYQDEAWCSDEVKRNLLPFVPPPCRKLSCHSVKVVFNALKDVAVFAFDQVFVQKIRYTLFAALYGLVWCLFIYLEIGALFFAATVMYIMYNNFEKRRDGELSAYSVFNPNQYRLLGESEIVNEILHRPAGTGLDGAARENNLEGEAAVDEAPPANEERRDRRRGKKKKGRRRRGGV